MAKIYKQLTSLIGNTPLVELTKTEKELGLKARVLAKVEYFNPGGSVKDRIALAMVEAAERSGALKPGGTIIEPTSGNTGVGLALVAAVKGYKAIIIMPETMSLERRKLIKAYGATLILGSAKEGMKGCIKIANELLAKTPNAIIPQQFENPVNPEIHAATTGPEIWNDTEGDVDIFVAGVGTGGTLNGVAHFLKSKNPNVKAYAVEPAGSPILAGGNPAPHKVQGISPGFVAKNYDPSVVDGILEIKDEDSLATARKLASTEGLLVGISSGAAAAGAIELAKKPENAGKTIVVVLPDTGERYLSTVLFAEPDEK